MRDDNAIAKETLVAIRDELDARHIPHKVSASKAGVPYSTWLSWFPVAGGTKEPQVPSIASLRALSRGLPADLFDMLLPDDFHAARCPKDVNYDDFAAGCMAFLAEKERAHHPDSPGGRDIVSEEHHPLDMKIIPLRGKVA